ncbi:MAG: aminotransferase class V-fold PLP-dependent enzyme [Myxococcaceae bacterium]|nr:aminotransferase class V-fold PLP-dependent enzyme [Myxococcaceae bacterium]
MGTVWRYQDFVNDALNRVRQITPEEACHSPAPGAVLLDIREADELIDGVLPGAVSLPRGLLEKHVGDLVRNMATPVYVYCATGKRSAMAADTLIKMGYANVFSVKGGFEGWREHGLPVKGGSGIHPAPSQASLTWAQVRAEFPIVARRVPVLGAGERPLIYLDHAASTHAPSSVLKAYCDFMEREYSNVHRGTHLLSRKATERFERAYDTIAHFIGADLKHGCVTFTANTTHAIDIASHVMGNRPGKVITTEMEHHSNELPHRARGEPLRCRVTDTGELDLNHLEELLKNNTVKLVALTAGSNVTGIMPPLGHVARLAHQHGALVLADGAQALARVRLDVKAPNDTEHIDFLAGAGHKAYAPFGAGFLYGPRALMDEAPPYLPGGGTAVRVTSGSVDYMRAPDRHQGGTPNIAGVVAMARALSFIDGIGREEIRRHEVALTEKTLRGLEKIGGITIYGPREAEKRLGVVTFNVDGVSELLTAAVLSEEGAIAVRNGRFCAHMYVDRLLSTYHRDASKRPAGMVRASVGLYNDESDIDRLLEVVRQVREQKWVGKYRVSGDEVSAAFAGRCADQWMEASPDGSQPS